MARIPIVDDHEDSQQLFGAILAGEGHEVLLAGDGDEGLRVYHAERPDVVIVDIFMPVKDGIEMIIELRRTVQAAKVIAVSAGWGAPLPGDVAGRRRFTMLEHASRLGADLTLRKPIDPENLRRAVRTLLTGAVCSLDDGIVSHGICVRHQRAALAERPSRSFHGVRLLVVVSPREEPLCQYLTARLMPVRGTAVIVARRHGERRRRRGPVAVERRQAERRRPRAESSLLGYMLVRFGELPPTGASGSAISP